MYSKLWSANMAQTIKFNLIHKSLHGVLLRSETTRNFPPKDDIRIMVNLKPFWNSYSREVPGHVMCNKYAPKLTFKVSVPTFSSAWKSFSKVISQLFWWILSFESIIFRYFCPKTTSFLENSSSCRKPTKCKLATPEVIRCEPGNNFTRAIHNCTCCALFWCLTTLRNSLRWCQDEKVGSLWLHVPSDMKNGIIRNDHMIQQQRVTDTSYSGFCWPKRRVGDSSWHITRPQKRNVKGRTLHDMLHEQQVLRTHAYAR